MSRWFYAQRDTKTPLIVSVFTIGLNIFLAYHLARRTSYDVEGLALAQSLVATIEVLILGVIMLARDHKLFNREFLSGVWRILSVTGFSVVAGFAAVTLYPLNLNDRGVLALGSKLFAIALATLGTHVIVSAIFDLEEVRPLFKRLRQLALRPHPID